MTSKPETPVDQSDVPAFARIRLFVEEELAGGSDCVLQDNQAHYLRNVMRCVAGDGVRLFNGRDGEWEATLVRVGKKVVELSVNRQVRKQSVPSTIGLAFAPIKKTTDGLSRREGC